MLGRTTPQGNFSIHLATSCSAKCLVNVYALRCSPRRFACLAFSSLSLDTVTISITLSAFAGAGYRISSHSTKYELAYALETCMKACRFSISFANSQTRLVPSKFVPTIDRKVSLKPNVAAECMITFTLLMSSSRSQGDMPRSSSAMSPGIATSFLNMLSGCSFNNTSKTLNFESKILSEKSIKTIQFILNQGLTKITSFFINSSKRCSTDFPCFGLISR